MSAVRETKEFPTPVVMSIVTGRLVAQPFSDVHECLEWAAGEPVWTHQLPRVSKELAPAIVGLLPSLNEAVAEAEQIDSTNWQHWRDVWIDRYGPLIAVPRLDHAQHERIDPLSEAAELIHPSKIIAVDVGRGGQ